jgi:hypothetical protein
MEELRKKQRQAFYDLDKYNAMEIRRRVERQAKILDNLKSEDINAVNSVDSDVEQIAEELSQKINDILDLKNYNLELRLRGAIATTGSTKDANIRILVLNSDFVNAWNNYGKLLQRKGIDAQTREYLYKTLAKSEQLIKACVYGYEQVLTAAKREDGYINKMYPQLFAAFALYSYIKNMFSTSNIKPVNERELNFFTTKLFEQLPEKKQQSFYALTEESVFNKEVRTDYKKMVDEENKKYQELFKRNMSPNELYDFRLKHFSEANYEPLQEMQIPAFKSKFERQVKKYPRQKVKDDAAYSEFITEQQDKEQAKTERIADEIEQLKLEYQAQRETQDKGLAAVQKQKLDKRAAQLSTEAKRAMASRKELIVKFVERRKKIEQDLENTAGTNRAATKRFTDNEEEIQKIVAKLEDKKLSKTKKIELENELRDYQRLGLVLKKQIKESYDGYISLKKTYEELETEESLAF